MSDCEIIPVTAKNVDQTGFFCYMSKRKFPGWKQKRAWLEERFAEGLKLFIVHENGRRDTGFIEYAPGESAWRVVNAPGYHVIHCLWVVGQGRGKGFGLRLIETCLEDARQQGKHGVVMISTDRVWLAKKPIFLKSGFVEADQAPPSFNLLVHRFDEQATLPSFPQNWEERQAAFGPGITVIRTGQCPYYENATQAILVAAAQHGLPARQVTLSTAREVQEQSPCPYGTFGVVLDGKLLSYTYLGQKELDELLAKR